VTDSSSSSSRNEPGASDAPDPRAAPQPRAALAAVPSYVAGRAAAPADGRPAFKLSSNENPHAPLPEVMAAVEEAAALVNRYPDMGNTALYDALSVRLGVPIARLAAATGSVALLYHLLQAFCDPGDEVVFAWRSFEAYPIAAAVCGAVAVQVPVTQEGRHDLAAMAAAVTERTKVLLVCTPNNPTGPAVTRAELEQLLSDVPPHVVVVVDEAYREFVRGEARFDALDVAEGRPNIVVMRTFAKAYGLAGLRVGYLVAPEPVAAAVRACALPFGVSAVAQTAAVAALRVEERLLEQVDAIVAERERVMAGLAEQGWQVPESQGNFVWLPLGEQTPRFAAAAEAAGVMVRPYATDGVRVTIGEPEANDVLLSVAAGFDAKA
jgi:histidinol-phosphate aminotransferase